MIYDETIVYAPIGGQNMTNGVMTADMSGSNMENGQISSLHVSWELPGGIVGAPHGHLEASWGNLLGPQMVTSDKMVFQKLVDLGYADGTGIIPEYETEARNEINEWINDNVTRIMNYQIQNPDATIDDPLSLVAFLAAFQGCVAVVQ